MSNSKALPMLTAAQLDALKDFIQIYEPLEVHTIQVARENCVQQQNNTMVYCLNKSIKIVQHPIKHLVMTQKSS